MSKNIKQTTKFFSNTPPIEFTTDRGVLVSVVSGVLTTLSTYFVLDTEIADITWEASGRLGLV